MSETSLIKPKRTVITAPPIKPMVNTDEPFLVYLPKSINAKGQKAGHISEQPKAIMPTEQILYMPGRTTTRNVPIKATIEQICKARV